MKTEWNENLRHVQVQSYGVYSVQETAEIIDELTARYWFVNVTYSRMTPPMAGSSDTALYISPAIVGGVIYAKAFIESWAAEDAKALRAKLLAILKRGKPVVNDRRYIPICLQIGPVRFYFHESLTDEELLERLEAAAALFDTLPSDALDRPAGPSEYGLAWDKTTEAWKGSIYELTRFDFPPVG